MAAIETTRRAVLTERIAAHREGDAVLSWLGLLGWQVQLDRDDHVFVGVAHHTTREGRDIAIAATGTSRLDVVWMLFEKAIQERGSTEADRDILNRRHLSVVA